MCIYELICILAIFVVFSFTRNNIYGLIVAQVATGVLYYGMIYSSLWYEGDNDRNIVSFGREKYNRYKGLLVGIVLMIPSFVMGILLILEKLTGWVSVIGVYKVFNSHVWPLFNILTSTGKDEAPYYIMDIADISWWIIILMALTAFIIPLITHISYLLGYKNIIFKNKIIYRNKK